MNEIFNTANWVELYHEDYFWPSAILLFCLIAGLFALLYLDRYKRWQATRQERNKMRQWTRTR